MMRNPSIVIPAKADIHSSRTVIPAKAGIQFSLSRDLDLRHDDKPTTLMQQILKGAV